MVKIEAKRAKNILEKVRGLIGYPKPFAFLLETRFGIHTFGLNFPIDVLILDNNSKIKAIKKRMIPNRIFVWNPKYYLVLELPTGTIEKEKLEINDKINLHLTTS